MVDTIFGMPLAAAPGDTRRDGEILMELADRLGAGNVYWMTQEFNATARLLYDRVATKTPFIKYQR